MSGVYAIKLDIALRMLPKAPLPSDCSRTGEVGKHPTAREGKAKSEAHNLGNA
jgi:hypothetical protein